MRVSYLNEKAFVTIPGFPQNGSIPFGRNPSQSARRRVYTASVWAFRCARFLANSVVSVPWGFEVAGEPVSPDHPAVELFKFVNEDENFPDLIRDTVLDFKLSGFAIWLPQVVHGRCIRIFKVPANRVQLDSLDDIITGFWWNTRGTSHYFPWGSFLFFKDYASRNPLQFDCPASVAIDKAKTDQGMDANMNSFLENYSIPPFVFTSDQSLKEPELDRYSGFWNKTFSKLENRFKAAFMGGGLKAQRLTSTLREMIFPSLKLENRLEICAAFGVLPALVGAVNQVNRADRIEQMKAVYHLTTIPDLKYFSGVINAYLQPVMYQNAEFVFYPEKVELMQEERSAKSQRVCEELDRGILNVEAAAELLGYTKDMIGEVVHRKMILDPQISAFTNMGIKADLERFANKARRMIEAGIESEFDFRSDFLDPHQLEKAIFQVRNIRQLNPSETILEAHE